MIFKRWFKPKWQHENPQIRQQVIATLSADDASHKEILHELAFNDASETVRKVALQQLNEFSLWWQASKHESADRLRQFAEQQVVQMLVTNQVGAALKSQFIQECTRSAILEKIAAVETDPLIRLQLCERLDKAEFWQRALLDGAYSAEQRQYFIGKIADIKVLERLQKQASPTIAHDIAQYLDAHAAAQEKPVRIRKDIVLLLAKLNALRERTDIAVLQQQYHELQQQWHALASDVAILDDAQVHVAKYAKIVALTDAYLAPRIAELQAKQQAEARRQQLQQRMASLHSAIDALQTQLRSTLADADLAAAQALETQAQQLAQDVLTLDATEIDKQPLTSKLTGLMKQFSGLPQLAEDLALAARLLSTQASQPLPEPASVDSSYRQFKVWQQQWRQHSKRLGALLPADFAHSAQQLAQSWQQHCEPLLAEQEKQIRQLRGRFQEFKRLHNAGKFNVLFGLGKAILQELASLSPEQQNQLSKEQEFISAQLADLTELQAFVATPRKQQILQELAELILQAVTMDTVSQRVAAVKQYRSTWRSLGRASAELDAGLNDEFNRLIELAFSPCRALFAEQDALRAKHLAERQALLAAWHTEAASLQGEVPYALADDKKRDQLIRQMQQQWQQCGAIAKEDYQVLQQQFSALLTQLKQQQKQQQQHMASQKQSLVAQAEALLTWDDAYAASVQCKSLQQQWQTLGFAGKALDQNLWQIFRQHCDAVFNKREQQRMLQHAERDAQKQAVQTKWQELVTQVTPDSDEQVILQALQQSKTLDASVDKALAQQIHAQQQQWQQQLEAKQHAAQFDDLRTLFTALSDPSCTSAQLPVIYRVVFATGTEAMSRHDLTIAMEWVAGVDSPLDDSQQRQQVQFVLLAEKHNNGEALSLSALLGRWLKHGPVTPSQQALLQRVQRIFLPTA
jgi:hypothetical protein